jgi:rare lipoprotein A
MHRHINARRGVSALAALLVVTGCSTVPGSGNSAARAPLPMPVIPPIVAPLPALQGLAPTPPRTSPSTVQTGIASWYGKPFHGRRTANGEVYNMHAMTAAHRTMPLPSHARVRNPANGREVIVRVNDRGPYKPARIIDLSQAAARRLGIDGIAPVQVERLTPASTQRLVEAAD